MKTTFHTLLLIGFFTFQLSAQTPKTKQDLYCNENIVWAGIIDVNIQVEATDSTDWKLYYEHYDYGNGYNQYTQHTKPSPQEINEIILRRADSLTFYQTEKLEEVRLYEESDLIFEPRKKIDFTSQNAADEISKFDIFKMRGYIYYDKEELNFRFLPVAVAVINSRVQEDVESALSPDKLGWLPIKQWRKRTNIGDNTYSYAKIFHRDIDLKKADIFKKEWTLDESMEHLMASIRNQANTVSLYKYDPNDGKREELISSDDIELLGTSLYMDVDEEFQKIPLDGHEYSGIRLVLGWLWDDKNNEFLSNQLGFVVLGGFREDVLYTQGEAELKMLFFKKTPYRYTRY